jgi:CRP/FNR family transcriptional regulator, cyclic AMP receptor protein
MDNNLINTLQKIEFLKDIDPTFLKHIADISQLRNFDKDEVVFCEGQPADSVYFVVKGKLGLELSPSTIYRKQLISVEPGEMLGWSSLVESPKFAATAVVVEPSQLVQVDGRKLKAVCSDDPRFGYDFVSRTLRALAKRLIATWSQLSHLYVSQYVPVTVPDEE